ncbi:LGFP repeat-containing protein [Actinoplanes teichomyceticus]|uniref:LGFP repeat-containing protein n=1 Tax=Actinoplanes teichomyceticus TaxID=1867 RepID=A0A561VMA6_ACTTI|nr:hypothetical protein [Actinoplanes teichomyceticus]TWG12727.1 LGFP repeat-containing protein [Actinoplanes teichomyceticus]GIF13461.1 hypothetical protein Ate01nite_34930 [Actinoplanes teichomyceticus]
MGTRRRTGAALRALATVMVGIAATTAPVAASPAYAGEGSYHCGILVYGAIEDRYLQAGAQNGPLGCPNGTETDAAGGGRWESFRGGDIYWHPRTGAHIVWGAIRDKWTQYGRERGYGFPLTDELTTPDGVGRYNHFERGSIYWTPATGAHTVYGGIRERWAAMGWERSCLRYPVSDETDTPGGGGRYQMFQGGSMYWTPAGGAQPTC